MLTVLRGVTGLLLMGIASVIAIIPMMVIALIKVVVPVSSVRRRCTRQLLGIAEAWVEVNKHFMDWLLDTRFEVQGEVEVRRDRSYLLLSNHQSWVDIPAILYVFNRRVPHYKFFLKWTLVFVPLIGQAVVAMEYPLIRDYSKQYLKKHPHLKGRNLERARKACEKCRGMPLTVVNFPEGARFNRAKHDAQHSEYRHLLRPKAGGISFVLSAIGDQIDTVLDVTVVYPDGVPNFWQLLSNQVGRVILEVRQFPLDQQWVQGNYREDPEFRSRFQRWLNAYWQEKDERISAILEQEQE